jgi:elongation factor Ts
MAIDPKTVAKLRADTGAGMMACKNALLEVDGDLDKAKEWLREKGLEVAAKKSGRSTDNGWIGSYIHHNGRVGVMVELRCETDFVAKGDLFQALLKDLCMHIAMANPVATRREEIPEDVVAKERKFIETQIPEGKPAEVVAKIVDGKLKSFFSDRCLLDQKFVKDDKMTISELLTEHIQKIGENLSIGNYSRFELGTDD